MFYYFTLQAPDEVNEEIKKFKKSLEKFYDSLGMLAVFFERNFKTSHLQIQCVPVPKACESQLLEVFQVNIFFNLSILFYYHYLM